MLEHSQDFNHHKSSIYFKAYWKGGRGVINLEKTLVSILHKELEYKVEKLENKKVGGQAAKDQNQI